MKKERKEQISGTSPYADKPHSDIGHALLEGGDSIIDNRIKKYIIKIDGDNLYENIKEYFKIFGRVDTFNHTLDVVEEVNKIASQFNLNKDKCIKAAYLHDIGRVVSEVDLSILCRYYRTDITRDEEQFPSILHQKASKVIAEKVFKVNDIDVLNAIECHTTLKANPSNIDNAVFLADKLSWKETENQSLINKMRFELKESIERAAFFYLKNLYDKREKLPLYHEWSNDAYRHFSNICGVHTNI